MAVSLSEAEVQAFADTNPVALRTLFLPDYDGVATSFARLLRRVVQRCKWDGQASGCLCPHPRLRVCVRAKILVLKRVFSRGLL